MSIIEETVQPVRRSRFITLDDVMEELSTSRAQVYALVRSGELPAIKIGGRGQWRVEVAEFDRWVERQYEQTAKFIGENPFYRNDEEVDASHA